MSYNVESYHQHDREILHDLVKHTNNLLTQDEIAAMKIKNALIRYGGVSSYNVNVEVENDVVTLNGSVHTLAQKSNAEDIVYMTFKGVADVCNHLQIDMEYAGSEIYEY